MKIRVFSLLAEVTADAKILPEEGSYGFTELKGQHGGGREGGKGWHALEQTGRKVLGPPRKELVSILDDVIALAFCALS